MPSLQANREVTVTSAAGADVLLLERLHGSEMLGQPFEYRVQLVSAEPDVAAAAVLGKAMSVTIVLPAGGERVFHGVVTRFACAGRAGAYTRYEAVLRPWLWLLTRASNCRIFQQKSVPAIVRAVCEGGGYGGEVNLDVTALAGEYAELPYCVQYRETDFHFVSRLLEEAGIYYWFRHEAGRHTMVLADSYAAHADTPGYARIRFGGEEGRGVVDGEAVHRWEAATEIQAGACALNDFDFEKAAASTSGALLVRAAIPAAALDAEYELYDYPGGYTAAGAGTARARARMESQHGQCEQINGETNARGVAAGRMFALTGHPRTDQDRKVLVTGTTVDVTDLRYASGGGGGFAFHCAFTAVGERHSYRPLPVTPKPVVRGPQTAMVVGKAGEEIWTDKYGRIKVQFHWDRDGQDDEASSCWVRVQQAWAGKGWGSMFIPRIGMEVVVSFLEGDPDRPLVTGCVYNGDAMPPYGLPGEQTKSTLRTNSSKGGGGYNELRFEDRKDAEEIFVQAEKDFNRVVKNNDTLTVGFEKKDKGDQTVRIANDQSLEVGHDRTVKVAHDDRETVEHSQTVAITLDQTLDVGGRQTVTVTGDQTITGKAKIVVTATTSIELKVGSSSILIEPAAITIKGAQITLDASGKLDAKAAGPVTVQGAVVKIN
ncbi:type VI secretion system secreted protein VgrG [Pseudoduganella lurida]|uniref:Type VI secretion system secreted protein VgrG n=1 Tax=Pseudoduganella lurida TaxID=1036180 RepID=A0A562RLR7_9BURK|nr:type VI secretion system tip protein TssI/VgrG [Pseudoduganella lurida]TWI69396.1 type VI secretion system secreted protein VgrG [Pseudoduganella lurida]